MQNLLIYASSNSLIIKQNKKALWIHRTELIIYFTLFLLVIFFIYDKSASKLSVKLSIIIFLTSAFLIVAIKKIRSFFGTRIEIEKLDDGFIINNAIKLKSIDIKDIQVKEMISTYSSNAYYDISIKINDKKYFFAIGADEKDKKEILEAVNTLSKA
jgi:hypothetical protein